MPRRLGPLRLPRIRCSRAVARRWVLTAAALAWLAVGGYGCFAYIDAYWTWRSYLIYLPPGYGAAARRLVRFPALYLLHPPPGRPDEYVQAGAAAVRLDELIHRHTLRPFLLVLPFGSSRRFRNDTEWANAGAGRYENFVLDTVHAVDSRWSTRRERAGRAIAGLSEGGYGAMNIALHHLDTFSVAESWSGYFDQTRSAAFAGASDSLLRANSPSAYVGGLARALRRCRCTPSSTRATATTCHSARCSASPAACAARVATSGPRCGRVTTPGGCGTPTFPRCSPSPATGSSADRVGSHACAPAARAAGERVGRGQGFLVAAATTASAERE